MASSQPRTAAALALLTIVAGAALPLTPALLTGDLPGAGPDVVSTTWGAWWLHEVGLAGLAGSSSDLANHPYGVRGAVLSPLLTGGAAALWSALGPGRALALTALLHTLALAAATGALARVAGARGPGPWVAAAAVLVGRVLPFSQGEASVVAVAALPVPLGLAALVALPRAGRWRPALAAAAAVCTGWAALENPYLAPLLPGVALLLALADWRRPGPALAAAGGGVALVWLALRLFSGSAAPDYPSEIDGSVLMLGELSFTVVDLPWSRVRPLELLWGGPVRWTLDVEDARAAGGGRTVGLTVLATAAVGGVLRPRQALPWLGLALGLAVLALGSAWNDVGMPFLYLNTALMAVARPLTQPVRFLVPLLLALAVAAGHGAAALQGRWPRAGIVLCAVFLLESLTLGAASLRLPTTPLPDAPCATSLDGAVLVWPWDARDGAHSRSQLFQMVHGQPGAHRGIASWARPDGEALPELRAAGVRTTGLRSPPQPTALRALGYRWVVVEPGVDPAGEALLERVLGAPSADCAGGRVFSLGR